MEFENNTTEHINNILSWEIHVYDIIIGAGLALLIPFIYDKIQRGFKKLRVIKFWTIFLEEVDGIKKKSAVNSPNSDLKCVLDKMRRIELLVSDILDEKQFHGYLDRIDLFEEVVSSSTTDGKHAVISLEKWLEELISSNKPPRYLVWTASKIRSK